MAIGAALISGVAIYLNAYAVKQLPDAAVFTTLKNGVAAPGAAGRSADLGAQGEARTLTASPMGPACLPSA